MRTEWLSGNRSNFMTWSFTESADYILLQSQLSPSFPLTESVDQANDEQYQNRVH